jgi:hypothetical protein
MSRNEERGLAVGVRLVHVRLRREQHLHYVRLAREANDKPRKMSDVLPLPLPLPLTLTRTSYPYSYPYHLTLILTMF